MSSSKNHPIFTIAEEVVTTTPSPFTAWLAALRIRTLPLSIAAVGLGNALAWQYGIFSGTLALWGMITALLLQILGNLANDYGDACHHADGTARKGPQRMVSSGMISPCQMKIGIAVNIALCIISGLLLLAAAFNHHAPALTWVVWIALGSLCILAALAYTIGRKPYGYHGLGDLAVLIFFGFVAVCGMFWLQTAYLPVTIWLPAATMGLWCAAVLNINNIRDIANDALCGKTTLAVKLGAYKARFYHLGLLACALFAWCLFVWQQYVFSVAALLTICALYFTLTHHARMTRYHDADFLNRELKTFSLGILVQTALIAFLPWFLGQ